MSSSNPISPLAHSLKKPTATAALLMEATLKVVVALTGSCASTFRRPPVQVEVGPDSVATETLNPSTPCSSAQVSNGDCAMVWHAQTNNLYTLVVHYEDWEGYDRVVGLSQWESNP